MTITFFSSISHLLRDFQRKHSILSLTPSVFFGGLYCLPKQRCIDTRIFKNLFLRVLVNELYRKINYFTLNTVKYDPLKIALNFMSVTCLLYTSRCV